MTKTNSEFIASMAESAYANVYFGFEHLIARMQSSDPGRNMLRDFESALDDFIDDKGINKDLLSSWSREHKNATISSFASKFDVDSAKNRMLKVKADARAFADEIIEYMEYHKHRTMTNDKVLDIITQSLDAKDPKLRHLVRQYSKRLSAVDELWRNMVLKFVKIFLEELAYSP